MEHKGLRRREYNCQACRFTFSDLTSLERHCKIFHKNDFELPLKCNTCHMTFILEEALHSHQKMEHFQEIKSFECKECQRKFFCKGSYFVHKSMHSNIKDGTIQVIKFQS